MEALGREFVRKEKKILVAKVIMVGIETCFSNHIYDFQGDIYLQL